jgi:ribosome-associated translation inhibitor RaiA
MASISSNKTEELLKELLGKKGGYIYAALSDLFAIGCWLYIEKKEIAASKIHLTVFRAIESLEDSKKVEKQIKKISCYIEKYKNNKEKMRGLFESAWTHHELKKLIGD